MATASTRVTAMARTAPMTPTYSSKLGADEQASSSGRGHAMTDAHVAVAAKHPAKTRTTARPLIGSGGTRAPAGALKKISGWRRTSPRSYRFASSPQRPCRSSSAVVRTGLAQCARFVWAERLSSRRGHSASSAAVEWSERKGEAFHATTRDRRALLGRRTDRRRDHAGSRGRAGSHDAEADDAAGLHHRPPGHGPGDGLGPDRSGQVPRD